ncbi:MAG TPA: DsbA family protein [Caulobacteraceae bacterium]
MTIARRAVLALAAAAGAVALTGAAKVGPPPVTTADMVMGRADAPVTLIEYASVTCSHCAAWNAEVFPAFKRRYVDTGLVRYVMRPLPTAPAEVAVAGFLMARCAGRDHYFAVVDDIMRAQGEMFADGTARNARPVLLRIGRAHGVDEARFNACVTDQAAITAMSREIAGAQAAGVNSTPTFFANGRLIEAGSVEQLDAALQPLLPARRRSR